MIKERTILDAVFESIVKASVAVPQDVKAAFYSAIEKEESKIAKEHLKRTLENMEAAVTRNSLVCSDTGFPLFYVKVGDKIEVEGGIKVLNKVINEAVEKATNTGMLRATMVHPLTRVSSVTNVGNYIPYVEYKFVDAEYVDITAVPKGGGAELFLTTPFRNLLLADGIQGVKKFVLDSMISAAVDGKSCPPNVIGIGIGGFPDLCMKLAKLAALLRPIGDRHPDKNIAALEDEFMDAVNATGIGPMGCGGRTTAFDVHVEYANTHTAGIPVAVNLQCSICRRATFRIHSDGSVEQRKSPEWFER